MKRTKRIYKGYKLLTNKHLGGYETYIYKAGRVWASDRKFETLKKHSISLAEIAIDNNEVGYGYYE